MKCKRINSRIKRDGVEIEHLLNKEKCGITVKKITLREHTSFKNQGADVL